MPATTVPTQAREDTAAEPTEEAKPENKQSPVVGKENSKPPCGDAMRQAEIQSGLERASSIAKRKDRFWNKWLQKD